MSAPRIGLIGARRVRQGLGPFVARDLHRLGADVSCVLGTSKQTAESAARELREIGIEARAWSDLDALLEAEDLDALAILSPAATHEGYLRRASKARLHVLCEKPFIWGGQGAAERSAQLVAEFDAHALRLVENCQWPCTLPAFESLHPGVLDEPLERLEMRLSPVGRGEEMLVDSLSHPLSVLQALEPDRGAGLEAAEFTADGADVLTLRFDYRASGRRVRCEVRLVRSESVPREAGLGVNGRWADRLVRKSDYSMLFAADDRSVELPDPLGVLLARFLDSLDSPDSPDSQEGRDGWRIVQRMQMLEGIVEAFRGTEGGEAL